MSDHLLIERRAILHAAIDNAPFDGWGDAALLRAATDAGYDKIMAARTFPEGSRDLLDFFLVETDREMIAGCAALDLEAMKIRERITAIIRLRLEQASDRREAVRRALSRLALPGHGPIVRRHLGQTMDAIWRLAGDNATDFNWYTKRGLLAGVYTTTLLHWLNDDSAGFEKTWAFLDRRIGDVMGIQKSKFKLQKRLEKLPNPWAALGRLRHPENRTAS
jgi:ubiquinone biosynthesis protein COQ9